jgi:ParB family chromosome partitioning protein
MADKTMKKGLGTGLGAFFGEDAVKKDVTTLPIAKVEPRADQPRALFDQESLEELAESIRTYGVIQPLTVRRLDSGYYQIIAGERRWRAARMAGLREIPVRVVEADDRRAMELALVENLQREDLNPIEEAKGFKTLMTEYGMTQEEAAQAVGKSRPAVANALRLLGLCPQVLEMVEDGRLSPGHARALLAIEDDELQLRAAELVFGGDLSVRQTESLAQRLKKQAEEAAQPQEPKPLVDYTEEVRQQLERSLSRRIRITQGRKKGRIELEYYDANDREILISNLIQMGRNWKDQL